MRSLASVASGGGGGGSSGWTPLNVVTLLGILSVGLGTPLVLGTTPNVELLPARCVTVADGHFTIDSYRVGTSTFYFARVDSVVGFHQAVTHGPVPAPGYQADWRNIGNGEYEWRGRNATDTLLGCISPPVVDAEELDLKDANQLLKGTAIGCGNRAACNL